MTSLFELRALRGTPDGASSALTRAKKLANLAIEKSKSGTNKPTAKGYEEAISLLYQLQFSENENEALEAQNLITSYENKRAVLLSEEGNRKRAVNELQLEEKKAYYAAATGVKANFIASNDIAGLVSFQRESLNEHLFNTYDAIRVAEEVGENTAALETELNDVYRRYKDIERLEDDILNGDGSSLAEYGVYIDGDKNGIDGIFIGKNNDLPKGFDKSSYSLLNEATKVNGVPDGNISIYGEHFVDQLNNKKVVEIDNRKWTLPVGVPGALRYDSKSDPSYVSNSKKGSFSTADFSIKNNPIGKNSYFTGITGRDADNNLIKTLFKSSEDGTKVFMIDNEARKQLEADPIEGEKIKNAFKRNEVDSRFINERVMPSAEPFKFTPMAQQPIFEAPINTPTPTTTSQQTEKPREIFFSQKNQPTHPKEPIIGKSVPDIIEKGKTFFRTNPLTKPFVGGFFGNK